ncbi:DUF6612 family protein [Jeotgalibaca porci]|uniref:DUF6612 family protein n=1 Tax=Jeotgalibaca porci TaxID=1868793 RepID=UPI0035A0E110
MNIKRLLFVILPSAVILSACQRAFATDIQSEVTLTAAENIENYHQVITIETETLTEENTTESTYAITEATIFPDEALAYGQRITKGGSRDAYKTSIYASNDGAFQKENSEEWIASATPDPLFSSISVYPYETFTALVALFESKGTVVSSDDTYTVTYSGYDETLNRELSALVQQFPISGTKYDVTITLDKETDFITVIQLQSHTGSTAGKRAITQNLTAQFSKYNINTPTNKPN